MTISETMLDNQTYIVLLMKTLNELDLTPVEQAIERIKDAKRNNRCVYTFGNGGSAATASHFANDLLKVGGVKAICISDMTPTTLAYGNDNGWVFMFSSPLIRLLEPEDVVVAFSCSGESENIAAAVHVMPTKASLIFLTGNNPVNKISMGSPFTSIIHVPHPDIRIQEDVHLAVCHMISSGVADG